MSKILIVEDDIDLQFLYEMMLVRHGHEVVGVETTTEAILNLTNELFDLIILDMNMPDMPGIKVIEFAYEDARLKHIPVVVVSANQHWRDQVHDLGVEHFWVKPVTMQNLIALVNDVLANDSGAAH